MSPSRSLRSLSSPRIRKKAVTLKMTVDGLSGPQCPRGRQQPRCWFGGVPCRSARPPRLSWVGRPIESDDRMAPLPEPITSLAFRATNGELAWRRADLSAALAAIADSGQAVLGGEV